MFAVALEDLVSACASLEFERTVHRERPERKIMAITMVAQVKDPGKSGAREVAL